MNRHRLSDTAFAALGAGHPSAATLAELRRAQFGKHLLLLGEIARAEPDPWYATERADPAGFRCLVADPLFGAWAADRLRRDGHRGDQPEPGGRWLTAQEQDLTIRLRLADSEPARHLLGLPPTGPLSDAEAGEWQRCLTPAWRLLVTRHRPAAEALAAVLSCLVPVQSDPAARGISATSADAFGAVAMSVPEDATALAVGLLHEAQHSILNATTYLFDLLEIPHPLGYSPWRDDPRPAAGLLHGAYAYLAVTRFWRAERAAPQATAAQRAAEKQPAEDQQQPGNRLAAFEFARWREAVADVADRLLAGGNLTAAGRRFVGALRDEVGPWLAEPVDPQIERLARAANADHRLRWRLRNLILDPDDAARLARAWRAGAPPPDVTPRLVPGTRRALERSLRLDLIHATVKGDPPPQPGGRRTAGDAAFLRGDHGTAESAYVDRLFAAPDDDAAWTGLALVTGHADRLECGKALTMREQTHPVAALRWISGA